MASSFGKYKPETAASLKVHFFDLFDLSQRDRKYEHLDQLTIDLRMGVLITPIPDSEALRILLT
jgi:hypothetical protein